MVRGRSSPEEVETAVRAYEVMVILDPSLEERTVEPSLDKYLNVIRKDGGSVENVDVWGRRRLASEIAKAAVETIKMPDVQAKFRAASVEPVGNSPAEMAAFVAEESRRWSDIIKKNNIVVD